MGIQLLSDYVKEGKLRTPWERFSLDGKPSTVAKTINVGDCNPVPALHVGGRSVHDVAAPGSSQCGSSLFWVI